METRKNIDTVCKQENVCLYIYIYIYIIYTLVLKKLAVLNPSKLYQNTKVCILVRHRHKG